MTNLLRTICTIFYHNRSSFVDCISENMLVFFFGSQCIERKLSLTKVKPGLGAFFVLRHPVGKWIGTILQLPGRTGPIPSRFIDLMSHVTLLDQFCWTYSTSGQWSVLTVVATALNSFVLR